MAKTFEGTYLDTHTSHIYHTAVLLGDILFHLEVLVTSIINEHKSLILGSSSLYKEIISITRELHNPDLQINTLLGDSAFWCDVSKDYYAGSKDERIVEMAH